MSGPAPAPVRMGILGCADIAVRRMLPAIASTVCIRLTAVASRTLSKARAVTDAFGGEPVEGYERLLERADIEAVYVPLPAALHAEWAERALCAGKHVLAEKPLTTEYPATDRLLALAHNRGLVLMENYLFLHHPQYGAVRSLLAEGAVGMPRHLSASFTVPPRPDGDIRLRADLGGGALLDVGGYPLRLALLLLGCDLEVLGASLRLDRDRGIDLGGAALLVRPGDGVTVAVTFGMEHRYTARWDLLGSAGRLTLAAGAYTPSPGHTPVLRLDGRDGVRELHLAPHDQVTAAVGRFAAAVRAKEQVSDGGPERCQARLVGEIQRLAQITEVCGRR